MLSSPHGLGTLGSQGRLDIQMYTTPRTWHPHIYYKPPSAPTPFFIADILGLGQAYRQDEDDSSADAAHRMMTVNGAGLMMGALDCRITHPSPSPSRSDSPYISVDDSDPQGEAQNINI